MIIYTTNPFQQNKENDWPKYNTANQLMSASNTSFIASKSTEIEELIFQFGKLSLNDHMSSDTENSLDNSFMSIESQYGRNSSRMSVETKDDLFNFLPLEESDNETIITLSSDEQSETFSKDSYTNSELTDKETKSSRSHEIFSDISDSDNDADPKQSSSNSVGSEDLTDGSDDESSISNRNVTKVYYSPQKNKKNTISGPHTDGKKRSNKKQGARDLLENFEDDQILATVKKLFSDDIDQEISGSQSLAVPKGKSFILIPKNEHSLHPTMHQQFAQNLPQEFFTKSYTDLSTRFFWIQENAGEDAFSFAQNKQKLYSHHQLKSLCKKQFGSLNFLHSKKLIFRDIKPENTMYDGKKCDLSSIQESNYQSLTGTHVTMHPQLLERIVTKTLNGNYDAITENENFNFDVYAEGLTSIFIILSNVEKQYPKLSTLINSAIYDFMFIENVSDMDVLTEYKDNKLTCLKNNLDVLLQKYLEPINTKKQGKFIEYSLLKLISAHCLGNNISSAAKICELIEKL